MLHKIDTFKSVSDASPFKMAHSGGKPATTLRAVQPVQPIQYREDGPKAALPIALRYIGIDIEAAGANTRQNPILAIGVATFDRLADGSVHRGPRTTFKRTDIFFPKDARGSIEYNGVIRLPEGGIVDFGDFEERCWNEFWSKNLPALENVATVYGKDRFMNAWDFRQYIDSLVDDAAKVSGRAIIVSDNPAFDVGRVNDWLCNAALKNSTLQTLEYLPNSETGERVYTSIRSTCTLQCMKRRKIVQYNVPKIDVRHDHLPENDAATIAWEYACADTALGLER